MDIYTFLIIWYVFGLGYSLGYLPYDYRHGTTKVRQPIGFIILWFIIMPIVWPLTYYGCLRGAIKN